MVQRNTLTPDEAGAAVTLMLVIGVACAVLLAGLAGPLAGAVRMDGLSAVLAALSVSVVLSIAALGPRAVLERELRYQTIALVEAGAAFVAAAVCVVAAVAGQGIWALIAYYVLVQVIRAAVFATLARHQIRLNFGWRRVSSILDLRRLGAGVECPEFRRAQHRQSPDRRQAGCGGGRPLRPVVSIHDPAADDLLVAGRAAY